ncbi:MAG: GDP-mannose 4,6-dehydratase, partial [Nitrospinota bacterium]|nr:GDP-mannose 4,6-dehydratase [Nitrospinota bacterium]
MSAKIILVTGGLGFIGKHFVEKALNHGHHVINVDMVNYAADRVAQREFAARPNYRLLERDIADMPYMPECDVVVNLAAESHVDESISDSLKFCRS